MKHFMIQTLKALVGTSEYLLRPWNYQPDELLVLCMHSTPLERRDQMEKLVDFLLLHFKSFDPMLLSEYFEGNHKFFVLLQLRKQIIVFEWVSLLFDLNPNSKYKLNPPHY